MTIAGSLTDGSPGKTVEGAVELKGAVSGRKLVVSSDQPACRYIRATGLQDARRIKSGRSYEDYEGVAIEMQGFPDAPNKPAFPSQLLKPERTMTAG